MLLSDIYRKLFPTIAEKISWSNSDAEITEFKQDAWKSKSMSAYYSGAVETNFFYGVTQYLFTDQVDQNASVIDFGAGTGRLSRAFAQKGCDVLAVDISKNMLSHINDNDESFDIKTLEASVFNIPCPNESFDVVVSMDLMSHFPEWRKVLAEKARLCKPGGTIIFNILNKENRAWLDDPEAISAKEIDFMSSRVSIAMSEVELLSEADKLGLRVESARPYDFLTSNAILGTHLNRKQVQQFTELVAMAIQNQSFLAVIKEFEEKVVRNLSVSYSAPTVIRMIKAS